MTHQEIREKFLNFFKEKEHAIVPSSSLIPTDSSVLLTTAGMQQFKPYFLGEKSPFGNRAVSIQKSFRTSDIESVGDESHLTFFEMLGNFSFGDYFKREAIEWANEFLKLVVKDYKNRMHVTVFEGNDNVPFDQESYEIWKSLGVPEEKILKRGREDNFWGPTGNEGPCGPNTEIYIDGLEIWNLVFNEYFCSRDKKLILLKQKGVDTGMGLERLAMILQAKENIFETDLFAAPFEILLNRPENQQRSGRIIADHIRGSIFLLSDGVRSSNKEAGYVLRRLIRRILVHAKKIFIPQELIFDLIGKAIDFYSSVYEDLEKNKKLILEFFKEEADKFNLTLEKGLKEFDKRYPLKLGKRVQIEKKIGQDAFDLHQTYGFPLELIKELLNERFYQFDEDEFKKKIEEEFKKHQEISRAGVEKKFGGHGLSFDRDNLSPEFHNVKLHTATHLLHQALRQILGTEVKQMGSDITPERLRFDFSFSRKLTEEEKRKVEDLVNQKIQENLDVKKEEMSFEEAQKSGALAFFKEKYPKQVSVYSINGFSKEICNGPHAEKTSLLGHFKIIKEESSSAGVRRIRAILE
ncbi:MAG: alanine--tRNA ligase [Parcubacteria group bacterium]|nr:alanine--tRNA ligase [Parcubacteria group bacterium]